MKRNKSPLLAAIPASSKKTVLAFCISILPSCLFAVAIPWYQANGGSNQFAVPAGKVLLVERFVWATPPASISVTMYHPNQSGYGGGNPPITFNVLPSGNQYTFSPPLRIGEGGWITWTGAADATGTVIEQLQLKTAASRKMHGGLGPFDIPLPLTGNPGVECRGSGGNHTLVFTFNSEVVSGEANVTTGAGSVSGSPTFLGNTMTVTLTGVADVQQIVVTLINVTDSFAQVLPDTAVSMNVLLGDTSGNKVVNSTDVGQTKLQSGVAATQANCRQDVTINGSINATDVALVKLRSGSGIP